jgi:hypothetical protein
MFISFLSSQDSFCYEAARCFLPVLIMCIPKTMSRIIRLWFQAWLIKGIPAQVKFPSILLSAHTLAATTTAVTMAEARAMVAAKAVRTSDNDDNEKNDDDTMMPTMSAMTLTLEMMNKEEGGGRRCRCATDRLIRRPAPLLCLDNTLSSFDNGVLSFTLPEAPATAVINVVVVVIHIGGWTTRLPGGNGGAYYPHCRMCGAVHGFVRQDGYNGR